MIRKYFKFAVYAASALFVLWCAISFCDVVAHNLTIGSYWKYNLFVIMLNDRI